MKYYGIVRALPGNMLIGGVNVHKSIGFDCNADAINWTNLIYNENIKAGKKCTSEVK